MKSRSDDKIVREEDECKMQNHNPYQRPSFTTLHICFISCLTSKLKGFCRLEPFSPHFRAAAWGGHISNLPRLRIVRMKEKAEISRLCCWGGRGRWVGYAGTLSSAVFNLSFSCHPTPPDSMIELNRSFLRLGRLLSG